MHNTYGEMEWPSDTCDRANLTGVTRTSPAGALGTTPSNASWYSFYGDAGRRLPTAPPGWHRCGALHTGWLATPHPPVGAAPRDGTACFQTGHDRALACAHQQPLSVCACTYDGGATVTYSYQLPAPWACPAAYCGTDLDVDAPLSSFDSLPVAEGALPPPRPVTDGASSPGPPPPPPLPPNGWCHAECPQAAEGVAPLADFWRSTANVYVATAAARTAIATAAAIAADADANATAANGGGIAALPPNQYFHRCDRDEGSGPMAGHESIADARCARTTLELPPSLPLFTPFTPLRDQPCRPIGWHPTSELRLSARAASVKPPRRGSHFAPLTTNPLIALLSPPIPSLPIPSLPIHPLPIHSLPIHSSPIYSLRSSRCRWYRFTGEAGSRLPTEPPAHLSCGTVSPGWLATTHPSPGDPPRYGMVCFRGADHPMSCRHHVEVRVCACSYDAGVLTTYAYRLPQPRECDAAYCGTFDPLPPSPPTLPPRPASPPKNESAR